jgi:hypothetical protein
MGWKPNFKLSNQSFSSTLLKQIEPWTYCLHEGEKTIKELEKKLGAKGQKVESCKSYPCIGSSPMIQQQQRHPLLP